mgnify:CR=1 FL=1
MVSKRTYAQFLYFTNKNSNCKKSSWPIFIQKQAINFLAFGNKIVI